MILLSFIICFFSCNQFSKKELDTRTKDPETNKNQIVFIFKKQNFENSVDIKSNVLGSAIFYSEKNDFTIIELNPSNSVKNDTIVKKVNSDKICLSHRFNKVQKFLYEFQKGDTVVFDYEKGYPYVSIINRKVLKYDNNFLADIKIEKPLEDFQFVLKNKRIRNGNENKIYFKELSNYRIKVEKFLDSIMNENLISPSIYEMYKASNKFSEINTDKTLLKSIVSDDLRRDDLLYLKSYRHFLNNYVVQKFHIKTQFSNDPMTCNSKIAFDSINRSALFSNKVKESLLYTHLVNIAEKNSTVDLDEYFKKFQEIVKNPVLNEYIYDTYLLDYTSLKTNIKDVYLLNKTKQKITINDVLSQHRGKVVYVDFWASWCAPCRSAMPSSRKLHEEYKDKDLVFVYISIDNDFNKWQAASEKEDLSIGNNNLLAMNYPNALFYKELQLKTIPRYLIYDKKGKLVHQNAPGPENNEIRFELNKYLKE
ncbi:TlpA disulfide reductase family protein [Flavobacterium sp. GT3R68]|uniref:TlpA family protein disulfide reductase n=1 Tax=Flavobacterium sp. GT3R68 TaxID=2594437 RepID=UPI00131576CF|nr:TlpA disulfide reductase family protein [Flavobacterium sp. GT3R68]